MYTSLLRTNQGHHGARTMDGQHRALAKQLAQKPLVTEDTADSEAGSQQTHLACRRGHSLWVVELFRRLDLGCRPGVGERMVGGQAGVGGRRELWKVTSRHRLWFGGGAPGVVVESIRAVAWRRR